MQRGNARNRYSVFILRIRHSDAPHSSTVTVLDPTGSGPSPGPTVIGPSTGPKSNGTGTGTGTGTGLDDL